MATKVEDCLTLLHLADWSAGSVRVGNEWQVDVTRGEERIVATGATEAEALRLACDLAKVFAELPFLRPSRRPRTRRGSP